MGWKPVSKARYFQMLEVLPPAVHVGCGFLVGEPWDHTPDGWPRYEAFFEKNGRYFVATEPMTVAQFSAAVTDVRRREFMARRGATGGTLESRSQGREKKLALIWRTTHRDFKSIVDTVAHGKVRCVLVLRDGEGTCLVDLDSLTDEEIERKLPKEGTR